MKPLEALKVAEGSLGRAHSIPIADRMEAAALLPKIARFLEDAMNAFECDRVFKADPGVSAWDNSIAAIDAARASYRALMEGT